MAIVNLRTARIHIQAFRHRTYVFFWPLYGEIRIFFTSLKENPGQNVDWQDCWKGGIGLGEGRGLALRGAEGCAGRNAVGVRKGAGGRRGGTGAGGRGPGPERPSKVTH